MNIKGLEICYKEFRALFDPESTFHIILDLAICQHKLK